MEEELNKKLAALIQIASAKEQTILQLSRKDAELHGFLYESAKVTKLKEELYKIYNQIDQVTNELNSLKLQEKTPTTTNGFLDLYKCDDQTNPKGNYYICFHDTKKIIGEIGCNLDCNNVHYGIDEQFQGQGYGSQALLLLVEYLSSRDLKDIVILIDEDNLASISLAEKLRIFFPSVSVKSDNHYVTYRFNIQKDKSTEVTIKK